MSYPIAAETIFAVKFKSNQLDYYFATGSICKTNVKCVAKQTNPRDSLC